MNIKLNTVLINRSNEDGFAIPIAIGMGLVMLLIGASMVVRSQGDQVTASAQTATNRALSVAETGITRYQSLINNNRVIAMYSRTGTISWTNASSIPRINSCAGSGAIQVSDAATTNWQDIDPPNPATGYAGDPSKGQYRLVDYTYGPTQGVVPGTGILTVEGRVNQSGGSTATTRLAVNIPIVNQSLNSQVPGLWIQNVPQNVGSNQIAGNILVTACTTPTGLSSSNVTTGYQVIPNPDATFPDTPALPSSNVNNISATAIDSRIWNQNLPNSGDLAQPDGSYHYLIQGNLSKSGSPYIRLSPNTRVVFYVQGNINIGGSATINQYNLSTQNGYPQNVQIYGNTFQRNTDSTIMRDALNRPLTKYNCSSTLPTISSGLTEPPAGYSGACPTTSLSANGGGAIQALIHAPDATGNIAGSGGGCNTSTNPPSGGGFIGAVWIKKWDRQSNNAGPMVCAYGNYSDYLSTQQGARPSIPSITSWQRQEVAP